MSNPERESVLLASLPDLEAQRRSDGYENVPVVSQVVRAGQVWVPWGESGGEGGAGPGPRGESGGESRVGPGPWSESTGSWWGP